MKLFNSLENIELIDQKEYTILLKIRKNKANKVRIFRSNKNVKQLDLYCFLKYKFGEPNGISSLEYACQETMSKDRCTSSITG